MKPNKNADHQSVSSRRLIERLSGWRLIAFFVSAFVNLGMLVALSVTPLFLNSSRMAVVLAAVTASHCVVLLAVAGFRFPLAAKVSIAMAHATACVWALSSAGVLTWMRPGKPDVAVLYLVLMITAIVTIGGVVVARWTGYHRLNRFSVGDLVLLVSAFAVLFPLILQVAPLFYFTAGVAPERLLSTLAAAIFCSATCLAVSNLHLGFLSTGSVGLSPLMILIGWFLFAAMVDWSLCQFSFLVAVWVWLSLIPVWRIREEKVCEQSQETFR